MPESELGVGCKRARQSGRIGIQFFIVRIDEAGANVRDHGWIELQIAIFDFCPFFFDFRAETLRAESWSQNFDQRLIDIVPSAVRVVDSQDRLKITQQILLRQKITDDLSD